MFGCECLDVEVWAWRNEEYHGCRKHEYRHGDVGDTLFKIYIYICHAYKRIVAVGT